MDSNNKNKIEEVELKNVSVNVSNKKILENINIKIPKGKIILLLGPNGAGKSSVSNVIMGNPKYDLVQGEILVDGENINDLACDERAKKGIFMTFQHPFEISGVTMLNFLRTSYNKLKGTNLNVIQFQKMLKEKMDLLNIDQKFQRRFINEGFSGGEKKKSEILQLLLFEPKYILIDEIDSSLDVDALKIISNSLKEVHEKSSCGILLITHHNKILENLKPDIVYILKKGKIVEIGNQDLIKRIETQGFTNN
jgi:Fe-S cluster assembly ATP-binding protein